MKKVLYILTLVYLCACSDDFEQVSKLNQEKSDEVCKTYKISQTEATEIANLYFSKTATRSFAPLKMDYIVDRTMTRSGAPRIDTLAYILNRGFQDGFVIVSSDNRVYPILATSEVGNFSYEKGDIVDMEFISRLGTYLEENKDNEAQTVTVEDIESCYVASPKVTYSWDQYSPWDKYVIREHPGSPVGCVAVATGTVMTHCKTDKFNYHGVDFYPKRIREGLASVSTRIIGGYETVDTVKYTFEQAIDYAAKMLYFIGKDVNMSYSPIGSSASSYDARLLLVNQGYDVKGNFKTYNEMDAVRNLLKKSMVYMKGYDTAGKGGHAWVIDGCRFCVDIQTKDTVNIAVHCDWGWGGSNNGYYSGKVFAVSSYNFGSTSSFAIGIK